MIFTELSMSHRGIYFFECLNEKSQMRICMIGLRGHNEYVFDGISKRADVMIVGVCSGTMEDDISPLLQTCQQTRHSPQAFEDYRRMFDELKPDMVTIAGPFNRHSEICLEAFRRGIHVFCEKPVATTIEQLRRLEEVHAHSSVHFAAMMGLRYDPAFYTAWRAVQEGTIGRVRLIAACKSYRLGHREAYFKSRQTLGGTIPWVGSHAIDWIRWYSAEDFISVYAAHSSKYNRDHGDLEVSALCQFSLTNEVLASVSIDYLRPANSPSHGDDRIRIVGTKGVIEVLDGEVLLMNANSEKQITLPGKCNRQIFADFVEEVQGGRKKCLVSPEDTFEVTKACLLARQSADEQQLIQFD